MAVLSDYKSFNTVYGYIKAVLGIFHACAWFPAILRVQLHFARSAAALRGLEFGVLFL